MKISDLADLVVVRNHISLIMGDKSICSKDDVRPLNEAKIKLDKKFVAVLKDTDIERLFSDSVTHIFYPEAKLAMKQISKAAAEQKVVQAGEQLTLDLSSPDGVWEDDEISSDNKTEEVRDLLIEQKNQNPPIEIADPPIEMEDTEAAELALISERVRIQKEQLKKEGRSNKRKSKEDDTAK